MEIKLDYIIERIKNIQNIQILELGVQSGSSTKRFIELCNTNNGFLTSIDIDDCSSVIKSDKWKFIHSSDDNFDLIDKLSLLLLNNNLYEGGKSEVTILTKRDIDEDYAETQWLSNVEVETLDYIDKTGYNATINEIIISD